MRRAGRITAVRITTRRLGSLGVVMTLAMVVRSAGAQPAIVPPWRAPSEPIVMVGIGLEPAVVVTARYLHYLAGSDEHTGGFVGGGLSVPTTVFSRGAWRADLLAAAFRVRPDGWAVGGQAATFVARNSNEAGRMVGVGVAVRATAGKRGSQSYWGIDLGWQGTLATHIRHSPFARATFADRYPPGVAGDSLPRDGWYRLPAQRYRAGVLLARRIGEHGGGIQLALGTTFVPQKQGQLIAFDLGQLPFYLEPVVRVPW
ncbi:MAG TPA: hypothetical protein VF178_15325 [Gemmatimonadaceae bacterium]